MAEGLLPGFPGHADTLDTRRLAAVWGLQRSVH